MSAHPQKARWCWAGVALLTGLMVIGWQRAQLVMLAEEKRAMPPRVREWQASVTRVRTAAEVRDAVIAGNGSRVSMARLLEGLPDAELSQLLSATPPTDPPIERSFFGHALGELASRDATAALDRMFELESEGIVHLYDVVSTGQMLTALAANDPEAAQAWFDRACATDACAKDPSRFEQLHQSLESGLMIAEMHRDPVAAVEASLPLWSSTLRAELCPKIIECSRAEHWPKLAVLAQLARDEKSGIEYYLLDSVAGSMLHQLGFDAAWSAAEGFELDEKARLTLATRLALFDLGPSTPERMQRLLDSVPDDNRKDVIKTGVARWGRNDPVAAARWAAGAGSEAVPHLSWLLRTLPPETGLAIADGIPDVAMREPVQRSVMAKWMLTNPTAAEAFLAEQAANAGR